MTIGDFSEQAEAYQRARPGYPTALLERLMETLKLSAGDPVVEYGAGTGIFTRMLCARHLQVTAVEPNAAMMQQAVATEARWISGTFEQNSVPTKSQAWAVAAQAFHWADPPRALPAIRNILRPGGALTVLWNNRANEKSSVLQWTEAAIGRIVPDFDEAYRDRAWEKVLVSTGDFEKVVQHQVSHAIAMSRSRYLDLWRSHNRLNNIAGADRFQEFFGELVEYLDLEGIQEVEVPYVCHAWTAKVRDN